MTFAQKRKIGRSRRKGHAGSTAGKSPARRRHLWMVLAVLAAGATAWGVWSLFQAEPSSAQGFKRQPRPPAYGYKVVNTYPHRTDAFCQGLVFCDGVLYEGTGRYGQSSLRRVDLKSGTVLHKVPLDRRLFGEGITIWGERIIQLTWKSGLGLVYDKKTMKLLGTFRYAGQGWGITHDDRRLIVSDGSSTLRFFDPRTFKETGRLRVTDRGRPLMKLNELEYIGGEIYANVWETDYIARISPKTGKVVGWIDLAGLLGRAEHVDRREAVLNGIAYDAQARRLFVTGKDWPKLFEIELAPK